MILRSARSRAAGDAMLPLSRALATRLVLSSKAVKSSDPAGDRIDAKAVRLMLVVLSRAAGREVDHGDWIEARIDYQEDMPTQPRQTVEVPIKALRSDLGKVTLAGLVEAHGRAMGLRASIRGEPQYEEQPVLSGGVHETAGSPRRQIHCQARKLAFRVDTTLAALAHQHADQPDDGSPPPTFGFDPAILTSFSCRYTPLVYLRLLAWFDPATVIDHAWKPRRARSGDLMLSIPAAQAQEALGTSGMRRPADVEQQVVRPVVADLAKVGITLSWAWERMPNKLARSLQLRVTDPRNARSPLRKRTPTAMRPPRQAPPPGAGLRRIPAHRPAA